MWYLLNFFLTPYINTPTLQKKPLPLGWRTSAHMPILNEHLPKDTYERKLFKMKFDEAFELTLEHAVNELELAAKC